MSNRLAQINERLDQITSKNEETINNTTDASPLSRIKQAIADVKAEISNMDIRTGVLCNNIMQHRLREKEKGRIEDVEAHIMDDDDFDD